MYGTVLYYCIILRCTTVVYCTGDNCSIALLYCTVLYYKYCIVLYFILHSTVLYCTVLLCSCTALHCTVLLYFHCPVLLCCTAVLHCSVQYCTTVLYNTVLYCSFQFCGVLLCYTVLCCTVRYYRTVLYRYRTVLHCTTIEQPTLYVSSNITSFDCLCYPRVPFQLASPPGVYITHIPKGNLVS